MYLYFDKQGILKEFINDESIRQNSAEVNTIYAYFESEVITDNVSNFEAVSGVLKVAGGAEQALENFSTDTKMIPYDPNRDLKYFRDGVTYRFYKYTLTAENLTTDGLALVTITAWTTVGDPYATPPVLPVYAAQGMVTFQIQTSVIMQNTPLSQTDLTYLLGVIASKENAVNKVMGFAGATDNTHFPTTQAVADYVEENKDIEYIVKGQVTYSDIEDIFAREHLPILLVNDGQAIVPAYYINTSNTTFTFVRENENEIDYWTIDNNSHWSLHPVYLAKIGDLVDKYKKIAVVTSSNGTLTNEEFTALNTYDNAMIIYKKSNNEWVHFTKNSLNMPFQLDGTSVSTLTDPNTGEITISHYKMIVSIGGNYSINKLQVETYNKSFLDAKLSEYLLNASASGDTLTINGIYNNSSSQTTFDVSHKLDKDFSGVNYNEATSLGQSDYFVINVGGTPKKVSFQTIFTELGLGTVSHFLGTYSSLSALQTAHPTASSGDYAYITEVDGADTIITMAIWDSTDNEWQVQDLSQYVLESVFQAYQLTVTQALNNKSKVTLVEWS